MVIARLLKGIAFYIIFCSLCVVIVLAAMRFLAARGGRGARYGEWRGEIDDALREAKLFLARCYENRIIKGGGE